MVTGDLSQCMILRVQLNPCLSIIYWFTDKAFLELSVLWWNMSANLATASESLSSLAPPLPAEVEDLLVELSRISHANRRTQDDPNSLETGNEGRVSLIEGSSVEPQRVSSVFLFVSRPSGDDFSKVPFSSVFVSVWEWFIFFKTGPLYCFIYSDNSFLFSTRLEEREWKKRKGIPFRYWVVKIENSLEIKTIMWCYIFSVMSCIFSIPNIMTLYYHWIRGVIPFSLWI